MNPVFKQTSRIWNKCEIDIATGCWLYMGTRVPRGHGQTRSGKGCCTKYTHRVMYENMIGPIPIGHQMHHKCNNPACCNPMHLQPLTDMEHRAKHKKTHCKNGHEFTEENTYSQPDRKRGVAYPVCRVCRSDNKRMARGS